VHPQAEQESTFRTFFARQGAGKDSERRNGSFSSFSVFYRRIKKARQLFFEEKSAPQRKSWLRLYRMY